jgi:excisionase family DNA binding protein
MKQTKFTIDECYLMMFSNYDDILTVDDVASMLRLPNKRVYRMIRAGELKSMKYERAIRVPKLWVIEYIQQYGFQRLISFNAQRRAAVTVYCQEPRSRRQIQEFLDLSDKKFFMDTVLHPLLKEGVIAMTIPDNPGHVRQRYVATQKLDID